MIASAALVAGACEARARPAEPASASASAALEPEVLVDAAVVVLGRAAPATVVSGVLAPVRTATLSAETAGRVLTADLKVGDAVERGRVVVRLDGSKHQLAVRRARAGIRTAEADLAHARRELERAERAFASGAISPTDRDAAAARVRHLEHVIEGGRVELSAARREAADTTLAAPFAGVIAARHVEAGELVAPGRPVVTLAEVRTLKLVVGVAGAEVGALTVGNKARVLVDDLGDREVEGVIATLSPTADPASGLFSVELHVDAASGELRGGMVARVVLPAGERAPVPVVAPSALVRRAGGVHVFVVEGGVVRLVRVRTGASDAERVEIPEGLTTGQEVVTSNTHALVPGTRVALRR